MSVGMKERCTDICRLAHTACISIRKDIQEDDDHAPDGQLRAYRIYQSAPEEREHVGFDELERIDLCMHISEL